MMQPNQVPTPSEQRSLGEIVSDFSSETTNLLRKEVILAKAEITQKITQMGYGISSIVIGGGILLAGLIIILNAAVIGLANALPKNMLWLSPLIVGAGVITIGLVLLAKGRSNLKAIALSGGEKNT
jgi:hypothetical protein